MKRLFAFLSIISLMGVHILQAQWEQTDGPLGGTVYSFAVSGSNLFAGTYRGVFFSPNNGATWTEVNNGLTNLDVWALAVYGSNLFVGTRGGGVFFSPDNGATWIEVNNGLTNRYVQALAVSGSNLFAGTYGGGVFFSPDSGATWIEVNNGLNNRYVQTFALSGSNLFVGTDGGGVFFSPDSGANWIEVNYGLTNRYVQVLIVSDSYLFAGTDGTAVWRRPLSEMVTGADAHFSRTPGEFRLEQNYPNPFNPATTVGYHLPRPAHVKITLFDTQGRVVCRLWDGFRPAGRHTLVWNGLDDGGRKAASGVYFYRLEAKTMDGISFSEVNKMVLMK